MGCWTGLGGPREREKKWWWECIKGLGENPSEKRRVSLATSYAVVAAAVSLFLLVVDPIDDVLVNIL